MKSPTHCFFIAVGISAGFVYESVFCRNSLRSEDALTADQMAVSFLKEGEKDAPFFIKKLQKNLETSVKNLETITKRTKILKGSSPSFRSVNNVDFFVVPNSEAKKHAVKEHKDNISEIESKLKTAPGWFYPAIDLARPIATGDIGVLAFSGREKPALKVLQIIPPSEAIITWGKSTFYFLDFVPVDLVDGDKFQTDYLFHVDGTKTYATVNGSQTVFAFRKLSVATEQKMFDFVKRFHPNATLDKHIDD